jgi:hypothetical protein
MEEKVNYAMSHTSLAHTFGNVTAFMTEYVKSWFPPNYFKTTTISSTIAYRYFNILDNNNKAFIKRNKPFLIIRPRVDIMSNDTFLSGSMLTTRITDNFYDRDFGNLQPFFDDKKKGVAVRYLMNRMKMYFDVSIITESQMEQMNQAVYLKNRVRQDRPFNINTALESNVPREILQGIAKDAEIDINDTKAFLDYLNSNSLYPVTYKLKNSSGRDEFFRYYPVIMDTMITNLSMEDGSKKGFVDDVYAINFTIETEFPTSGLYYYFTKDPETIEVLNVALQDIGFDDNSERINPVFTVTKIFDIEMPPGWNLYTAPLYKVESNQYPDTLDISTLFNNSMEASIKYHLKNGIPMERLIRMTVIKDNEPLPAEDFDVDYEKMQLITKKVNTTSTYRLIIHANTLYVNELVSEILEFNKEK